MLYRVAFLIIIIALAWHLLPQRPLVKLHLDEEYDYVIVGGGAAGSVLASRLSADSSLQVAVLEAGPDDAEFPETNLPINYFSLQTTDVDWAYKSVPQKQACKGLKDRRSAWPRGRGLGGSTLINGLMVTRGSRHDFDRWEALGNKGWGYATALPYLKKVERVTNPEHIKSGYRGTDGPITISEPIPLPTLTDAFLTGLKAMGHPIRDCNGEEMIGAMPFQGHIKNGARDDTSKAYLKPAMSRPNLHVSVGAHVMKILFEGKRAVGVEYLTRGVVRRVYARKEVIMAAGAVATPQIMMLSGIGPKEHLQEFKIPVVADLPVGENLQDHLYTEAVVYTMEKPVTMHPTDVNMFTKLEYYLFGTGPIAGPGRAGTAFFNSIHQKDGRGEPALQFIFDGLLLGSDPETRKLIAKSYNQDLRVFDTVHKEEAFKYGATLFVKLLRPLSVGNIRLSSGNPFDHPLIDPQYLTEQRDVDIMVEGIRKAHELMESEPFRKLGSRRQVHIHPNCTEIKYDSDEYWECYVRSNTLTVYHPVGTCKMGPDGDPTAVVDTDLRVRGVDGLRIVDASVMPDITSGNTLFPVLMIAERASDIIIKREPS